MNPRKLEHGLRMTSAGIPLYFTFGARGECGSNFLASTAKAAPKELHKKQAKLHRLPSSSVDSPYCSVQRVFDLKAFQTSKPRAEFLWAHVVSEPSSLAPGPIGFGFRV